MTKSHADMMRAATHEHAAAKFEPLQKVRIMVLSLQHDKVWPSKYGRIWRV